MPSSDSTKYERTLYPFEICLIVAAIGVISFVGNPLARESGTIPLSVVVLQIVGCFGATCLGARAVFPPDQFFAAFQYFLGLGVGIFSIPAVIGVNSLATLWEMPIFAALAWLVLPIELAIFTVVDVGKHNARARKQRWQIARLGVIAGVALCAIWTVWAVTLPSIRGPWFPALKDVGKLMPAEAPLAK